MHRVEDLYVVAHGDGLELIKQGESLLHPLVRHLWPSWQEPS